MRRLSILPLLAAALLAAPSPVQACGASLFGGAEGQGVRAWRAPRPAHVVIFADPTLERRGLGDPAAFGRALQRSGHEVTVARTPDALAAAFASGPVDVVMADLLVMDSVAADARGHGSDAALLPIVVEEHGRIRGAVAGYQRAIGHDADLREALRAIHALVAGRAQG